MSFSRPLLLLVIGGVISLGILKISLDRITSITASIGCSGLSDTGEATPFETTGFWDNRPIASVTNDLDSLSDKEKQVLGAVSGDHKWIEVDLSEQRLIAHDGDKIFLESLISSGLWNRTPTGEFRIWYKSRSQKMEGGSRANGSYYYLPNVPYNMFFNGDYGIHGTYWHSNFGTRMSHGCVNSPTAIAEQLFYWTDPQLPSGKKIVKSTSENPGTRVIVHE